MKDLLLHAATRQQLERIVQGAAHAVLIAGELGAGKQTVAYKLASQLLGSPAESSPYVLGIMPDGKSIGIEQIRELQKFLLLKTTGTAIIRRIVIIDQADKMTVESQNALLKILEEPPADTVIILTASVPQNLKPTIHSRVQTISLLAPAKADVVSYFSAQGLKPVDIERAYMVSNGQVGLMTALLDVNVEHELASSINEAKILYGMSTFERLSKVDAMSRDKEALPSLLYACKRICMTALEQAALRHQTNAVKTWHRQLKLIVEAENAMPRNPNAKLLLTHLFIQMGS